MKRILATAAAVAASVGAIAAPANAQDVPDPNDYLACTTPVTSCVAYYGDAVVGTVQAQYDWVITTLQNGPNINSYCKLIWPDGCNMPTP
jgi:opacity protein-like surface antigen